MAAPFLATITVIGGGGAQPKGTGSTHVALITPLGGGHIDAGLPEGPPEHIWGGGGERPPHIDAKPPWAPGHPDAGLPVPPGITAPPVPPNLAQQVVVLWHLPGQVEWHGKVIDPSLVAGTPLPPTPTPKA